MYSILDPADVKIKLHFTHSVYSIHMRRFIIKHRSTIHPNITLSRNTGLDIFIKLY